jgi:hypothetical protein
LRKVAKKVPCRRCCPNALEQPSTCAVIRESSLQLGSQLPQAERRPQSLSHRIASNDRFKQLLEIGKQVGSSVIPDLRPPPRRRTRSSRTEPRSSRSSSPRYIVRRASPVASATALTPSYPIVRAFDAAQRRRLLSSSKGAIDFRRFRRVLIVEALITRRFYRRRLPQGNPPATNSPST